MNIVEFPRNYTATPPDWTIIPQHMHGAIQDYVERGLLDDDFLEAIVCNDLRNAVLYADHINVKQLDMYVRFFLYYCPAECWGNVDKVADWMSKYGLGWKEN
jgi:hypothetical protein